MYIAAQNEGQGRRKITPLDGCIGSCILLPVRYWPRCFFLLVWTAVKINVNFCQGQASDILVVRYRSISAQKFKDVAPKSIFDVGYV